MRFIKTFCKLALASLAIDLFTYSGHRNLVRVHNRHVPAEALAESEIKKQRKRQRLLKKIPYPLPLIRKSYRPQFEYRSTKSRNVRDLDQQKIRRKFKNC